MVTRYVGQPIRRTEDLRLVTGAGVALLAYLAVFSALGYWR